MAPPSPQSPDPSPPSRLNWYALGAIAALVCVIIARVLSPSDLWAYTQYKTMSYTTDILVHGGTRWILPMYCGAEPATKPPLYNWLAVPTVKLLGFNSELGHKFPSMAAMAAVWLLMVRLGRRLDTHPNQSLGWLTGLIVVANYTIFKLGYVARPDMLLTLWLTLAWSIATHVFVSRANGSEGNGTRAGCLATGFWACIALAALTKGPAALIGVLYAVIAARAIGGSWRAMLVLHPVKGALATGLIAGAWLYAVWRINPNHAYEGLWQDEVIGRITGTGAEEAQLGGGWRRWLMTLLYHPFYFLSRFAPWSVPAFVALGLLWRRDPQHPARQRRWRTIGGELGPWLWGAAIYVLLVIAVFTLSTGKRSDYLAAAYPPGALLAAWWLFSLKRFRWVKVPWIVGVAAASTLVAVTTFGVLQPNSLSREYSGDVKRFIDQAYEIMSAEPLPTAFWAGGATYVQPLLGSSTLDGREAVIALLKKGRPCWIMLHRGVSQADLCSWLERQGRPAKLRAELVHQSKEVPTQFIGLARYSLYRVMPVVNTTAKPAG